VKKKLVGTCQLYIRQSRGAPLNTAVKTSKTIEEKEMSAVLKATLEVIGLVLRIIVETIVLTKHYQDHNKKRKRPHFKQKKHSYI
jgi:hypothetical protein